MNVIVIKAVRLLLKRFVHYGTVYHIFCGWILQVLDRIIEVSEGDLRKVHVHTCGERERERERE